MPVLSRRGRLAIAAVVDIAIHGRETPVAARALAERHNLPPRHMEPMLQVLVRSGILRGTRGPKGGYDLARERRRVSCGEIVRAVMVLADDEPEQVSPLVTRIVVPAVASAEGRFFAELDKITIEQLCNAADQVAVTPRGRDLKSA